MSYKLICFDMDGVICQNEAGGPPVKDRRHVRFAHRQPILSTPKFYRCNVFSTGYKPVEFRVFKDINFWMELHKKLDTFEQGKILTEKYLHTDYAKLVEEVVGKLWKGKDAKPYFELVNAVQYLRGVKETFAYQLIIRDGKVSGEFLWPIGAGKENKARILHDLCTDQGISPKESIYIGDSETDIEACKEAGISIAFNPTSEKLREIATHVVESETLSAIIKYLP